VAISQKSIKILWANAGGRCAFPHCQQRLCTSDAGNAAPYTIGEMAHIRGERPGSNRYDASQTQIQRDDYENLILLCPNHHTIIDRPENEDSYNVEVLQAMKAAHENFVSGLLEKPQFADKREVAAYIYPLLKENHEVFISFGPLSEIARRNPGSDAHGIWLSERLATIIPNNRRMIRVLEANLRLFGPPEQTILARFRLHVRSYERWVLNEVTYEGVVRFPTEFESLISGLVYAGT
jgi:hypothetical protein